MSCTIINLEYGMPSVERARVRLEEGLRSAKAQRVHTVKIIHGYGSSGKGGAIKRDVQSVLAQKKRCGAIKHFVSGENFSPFDSSARAILDKHPELTRDSDYSRGNDGITIVLL